MCKVFSLILHALYISRRKPNRKTRRTLISNQQVIGFKKLLDFFIKIPVYFNIFFQNLCNCHSVKSVRTRNFAGLYFPAFRLNTGTYSESLRIHFECGKMQIGKILNTGTFTRCVYQRNLLMRNLHLTCNLGAPHLAFSCSKSTIKTKKQSHQIPHIVVVFPLSKNHSVYSFRYCIVILGLVTRKVRP